MVIWSFSSKRLPKCNDKNHCLQLSSKDHKNSTLEGLLQSWYTTYQSSRIILWIQHQSHNSHLYGANCIGRYYDLIKWNLQTTFYFVNSPRMDRLVYSQWLDLVASYHLTLCNSLTLFDWLSNYRHLKWHYYYYDHKLCHNLPVD